MKKAISFILVFMLLFTTSTNFIEAAALDPSGRNADIY